MPSSLGTWTETGRWTSSPRPAYNMVACPSSGDLATVGCGDSASTAQLVIAEGLALVDLNHDGALDLVTAAFSFEHSDEVAVRLRNGNGTFRGRHWIRSQSEPLELLPPT